MEWTKYVLACTLGVCMLILFGRRDEGRDKWIFGLAVGGSLAAMELTVEYMYHKELWVMASSVMKSLALFSLIVLAGYGWEWIRSHKREDSEQEPVHPVRQWIEEYQESFAQLSRSFCMTPQMTPVTDRGELLFQRRLAENRIAEPGRSGKWCHTGRSHGTNLWDKRRCAAGAGDWKAASLYGNNIDPGIFLQSRRTKATSLCDHAYEA